MTTKKRSILTMAMLALISCLYIGVTLGKYMSRLTVGNFNLSITAAVKGVLSRTELREAIKNGNNTVEIGGGEWSYGPYDNINEVTYQIGIMTATVHAEYVTINDGTFSSGLRIDKAVVTINGGIFHIDVFWAEGSDIIINGGIWTASDIIFYADQMPTITIKGGEFRWNPTPYLATGYVASDVGNGVWRVQAVS